MFAGSGQAQLFTIATPQDRELLIAFKDTNPQAPTHVLIIPRKEIRTHADITDADRELLGHLHLVAVKLAKQLGIEEGYRLVVNCRDLYLATGLEEVEHVGPSSLDRRTLQAGIVPLPDRFLEGVGYSAEEIAALRTLYVKNAPPLEDA